MIEHLAEKNLNYVIKNDQDFNREVFKKLMINNARGGFSEDVCQRLMYKILEGIAYLHEHNVIHRDIKPENILWRGKGTDVVITDFGFGKQLDKTVFASTMCGTLMYLAPEIKPKQVYDGYKVDIFSCGCLLYTLACGQNPFDGSGAELMKNKEKGVKQMTREFKNLSLELQNLILKMTCADPLKRPTAKECLEDEFFTLLRVQ